MKDSERKMIYLMLASLCMGAFLVVMALVITDHAAGFDDPIRQAFYALRSESLTPVLIVVTQCANKFVIIGLCLALLALPRTRLHFGVPLSAGALGTIILNSILKHIVMRPRPDVLHLVVEDGYSFPSGHSITSMFFYGMAIWLIWHYAGRTNAPVSGWRGQPLHYEKKTAIILTVLLLIPMVAVGLTRIYLGVHFPTDVLGAWCLAGSLIFVEAAIILTLERRSSQHSS